MKRYCIFKLICFAFILLSLLMSSCKDWLTLAPENDLIKEKFWTKREDVEGALAATYSAFRAGSVESFIWGELRADMVTFGTQFGNYNKIAGSDISPANSLITWASYYNAINLANTLMHYDNEVFLKDKTFTKKMKDGVDAEALFIRSLSYFYLVRLWKDVPLVLEPSISDTTNLFLPKSSEKLVLAQIIKDLLVAKNLAYTTEFKNDPEYFVGSANKYSIMALLADVYLWDEQYQKCSDYCDSITNSGLFALESTETWFNIYNPGNSPVEGIFEIQYDDNLDAQENPIYDRMLFQNQLSFSKKFVTIMAKQDLRMCGINTPGWKYLGVNLNSGVRRNSSQRDGHFIYYRYADIILMKAEALTELNQLVEANALLRQTAERAGITHTDIGVKEDLRNAVLDERAREFIIEGKRWFDLLRAAKRNHFEKKQIIIDMILAGAVNIQQQQILKTKVFDTLSYYLPIPEQDILYNQNLKQNPFYDR
ncbi:MAG: RagB/SusD family nutrient uptake outer membrane protein [Prolixibacteraceae bacterium]|nr:RagB/SusD family nutrient uptake outer membrane protein [Prolixibacteraceae bacterium]